MNALFSSIMQWMEAGTAYLSHLFFSGQTTSFIDRIPAFCMAMDGIPHNFSISGVHFPGNAQDKPPADRKPDEGHFPLCTQSGSGTRKAQEKKNLFVLRTKSTGFPTQEYPSGLQELFRSVAHMTEGVLVLDEERQIVHSNQAFRRIFQCESPPDGKNFEEVFGPDGMVEGPGYCDRFYRFALTMDHPCSTEISIQRTIQGESVYEVYYALFLAWDIRGKKYSICTLKNLNDLVLSDRLRELQQAEMQAAKEQNRHLTRLNAHLRIENAERNAVMQALRRSESRYRDIFDNATEGIFQWTPEWRLMSANMSFAKMMGYTTVNALLHSVSGLAFHFCYSPQVERELVTELERKGYIQDFNFQMARHDGTQVWASMNARKVISSEGATTYYEAFIENITVRKMAEEKLVYQAFHDPLTGLANRTLFHDRIRMSLRRAARQPSYGFAVLYLDLDRFKIVNDSFGHTTGDDVLCHAAKGIISCVREVDTVARFGGDEFAILIDNLHDGTTAVNMAKRIHAVLNEPFMVNDQEISIGASTGIVLQAEQYENPEEILRDADTAMYQAKTERGVCFKIFSQKMREETMESIVFETDLRQGLKNNEFYMAYQPIISMHTRQLHGFEALMRWHRRGIAVSPAYFIAVAEETGLIKPLGLFMLEQVCRQAAHWQRQFKEGFVTHLNISGRQLMDPNFPGDVKSVLKRTGVNSSCLVFEITESVLMDSGGSCIQCIKELRELGIRFCLDDFGTGFSSLSYLKQLPICSIKIDRSFVADVETDHDSLVILRNLLTLGHDLKLDVIVEGIEYEGQVNALLSTGCELGQGFHFHRPMPVDNATELLLHERLGVNT